VFSSAEKEIKAALCQIAGSDACACVVHEAKTELTPDEIQVLGSDYQKKWSSLRSSQTVASRRLEWSEARRCEAGLRALLGGLCKTSISHSRVDGRPIVFSVGVMVSSAGGVGVDAELKSRAITDAVSKRFSTFEEKRLGLEPLQIWVVKEALFKSNPENSQTLLPMYQLMSFDPGNRCGTARIDGVSGAREFRFSCIDWAEWTVAVAVAVS
jgi:hypothetical protein